MKKSPALAVFIFLCLHAACPAESVLFIGNSYTIGSRTDPITAAGGIPAYVEAIAVSKGKNLTTKTVAARGKDLSYHLGQAETDEALKAAKWDWVVLQELSTKPTRIGDPDGFFADAATLYSRAREASPDGKVLLYQTWPRPATSSYISKEGKSKKKKFESSGEMLDDVVANYAEARGRLEAAEPGDQVALARVGEAFVRCLQKYPQLSPYGTDGHHASPEGYYLAALVIYGALFDDSPVGATHDLPGLTIDAETAKSLQEIAASLGGTGNSPTESPAAG